MLKSKKINNDQELIQSEQKSRAQNKVGNNQNHKITNTKRTYGNPNEKLSPEMIISTSPSYNGR